MHDSEALQRKLLKLLQDLIPTASITDAEVLSQELSQTGSDRSLMPPSFPLSADASSPSSHHGSDPVPDQEELLFEVGEIPAVQDRFYSLLKNRLQAEIQRNPPLFPWETEVHDYETDLVPNVGTVGVGAPAVNQKVPVWLWINHLRSLNLPVALPDDILGELLQRCQDVAHSTMMEGVKLVRAVEDLFPGQSQALNHLAGLVMTAPARSPETATASSSGTNYPPSYETAAPAQQMVLSLLAAKEIIASLTFTLSASKPELERCWFVDDGTLRLTATYEPDATCAKLRLQANFPCGGSLLLRGNGQQASVERATGGYLSVELFDLDTNQPYSLEVHLREKDSQPLTFTVRIVDI